ncbi:2-aminoadipate transaminase [Desulfobaculum xiamenense]|uniref:2-aminoadipate transaminase n=1 Tax=Desulfobaculum xiamenense TaxID=995050 RepID=A0A846QGR4_9BACT|nr:PLP-dependent aminotransferase family protein [Desulfobaculum xiamenense]NJB67478.1 2-aminoadipate transaminase [Desulfobaculum xiamenense]
MSLRFAARMESVPRSFIREILKVTQDSSIISFAGGLPNPDLFPVEAFAEAAARVITEDGAHVLQYATTEGYQPLREWIAARYRDRQGLNVTADDIVITSGSQQGLDLMGKIFLNNGDTVIMESPGYLGAIQAFSMYGPKFVGVPLEDDGPDLDALERAVKDGARLFYAVTSFQNPSGLTYTREKRQAVADILKGTDVIFAEDNPYGELRFRGENVPPLYGLRPENSMLMGSFSKIAAPGFRLGWVATSPEIRQSLVTAKQAADLHTGTVAQRIMYRYLMDNDIDQHIARIRERYGRQGRAMLAAAEAYFPEEVKVTRPEGGMFLWAELPTKRPIMELFDAAIARKVAFVPGKPFYVDGGGDNTMRLNFSNASEEVIDEGMKRLGECIKAHLAGK